MKKLLIYIGVVIAACTMVYAQSVDRHQAQLAAQHWWNSVGGRDSLTFSTLLSNDEHIYLFMPASGRGFVMMSSQFDAYPIIGYSTEATLSQPLPLQFCHWVNERNRQVAYVAEHDVPCADNNTLWKQLIAGEPCHNSRRYGDAKTGELPSAVSPLLVTAWSQSPWYNRLCPVDSNATNAEGRAVVGCVATAMAQVMCYWQYPERGTGSHSYNHSTYGPLSVSFDSTVYQWDSMPYRLDSGSTEGCINAVATLCYHAGVAVDMNYGPLASGSYVVNYGNPQMSCAQNALATYFGYSEDIASAYRDYYSDDTWCNLLATELSEGRPVLYSAYDYDAEGGHAFICDGYSADGLFHFDWGWHGVANGYYSVSDLNPLIYHFNSREAVTYQIEPRGRLAVSERYITHTADSGNIELTLYTSWYNSDSVWHILYDTVNTSWLTFSPTQTTLHTSDTVPLRVHFAQNTTGLTRVAEVLVVQADDTVSMRVVQFGCSRDEQCVLRVVMNDVYGDGYQGNYLSFETTDGYLYGTTTLPDGYYGTDTMAVCSDSLLIRWYEGLFSSEDGFAVLNAEGDTLVAHTAGEDLQSQIVLKTAAPCGTVCSRPQIDQWTVDRNSTTAMLTLHWAGDASHYQLVVTRVPLYDDSLLYTDTIMIDSQYIYTYPLPQYGTYTFRLFALCDSGMRSLSSTPVQYRYSDDNAASAVVEPPVAIYPNPTAGKVQVVANQLQTIQVYMPTGQLLLTTYTASVDLSRYPAGVYLLRIVTAEGVTIGRVLKQ